MKITDEAVEAAARALYFEEQNQSMGFDQWPDYDHPDNVGMPLYEENARAALAAALPHLTTQPADVSDEQVNAGAEALTAYHGEPNYPGEHHADARRVLTAAQPADVDRMVREAEERLVERIETRVAGEREKWADDARDGTPASKAFNAGLLTGLKKGAEIARSVRDEGGDES